MGSFRFFIRRSFVVYFGYSRVFIDSLVFWGGGGGFFGISCCREIFCYFCYGDVGSLERFLVSFKVI